MHCRIRIETKYIRELASKKVVVRIYAWPNHSFYPLGHLVRPIGITGDRETENRVILLGTPWFKLCDSLPFHFGAPF